MAIKAAPPSFQ
ncbi:hypothetical protein HID58_020991 [Brassica napus]|uniref:Uncharacterized protein n=1 Tax=Brassica napus TaxID=3708 RepID=A0ABQ8CVC7_BRANA|nr:hypothetical protein HID58_020991 [Brassica napus]